PESEPGHHARTEVFDDDVGHAGEPARNVGAGRVLEIERDRLLAAVDHHERLRATENAAGSGRKRAVRPFARLDLEHLRAKIDQQSRADRSREDVREIENPDPFEWLHVPTIDLRQNVKDRLSGFTEAL